MKTFKIKFKVKNTFAKNISEAYTFFKSKYKDKNMVINDYMDYFKCYFTHKNYTDSYNTNDISKARVDIDYKNKTISYYYNNKLQFKNYNFEIVKI